MRPSVSCTVSKAEYSAWTASIFATGSKTCAALPQNTGGTGDDWAEGEALTGVGLAEGLGGALAESDVLGLACLSKVVKGRDGLLQWRVCSEPADQLSICSHAYCESNTHWDQCGAGSTDQA